MKNKLYRLEEEVILDKQPFFENNFIQIFRGFYWINSYVKDEI